MVSGFFGPSGGEAVDGLAEAVAAMNQGDLEQAERLAREALAGAKPGSRAQTDALSLLAFLEAEQGKLEQARARYLDLRERYRRVTDPERESVAVHQLGMVARLAGDYSGAEALFDEEAAMLERHLPENRLRRGGNLYERAFVRYLREEFDQAERLFRMGLDLVGPAGDQMVLGCLWRGLGQVLAASGDGRGAAAAYQEARAAFTAAGDQAALRQVEALNRSLNPSGSEEAHRV